MRMPWHSKTGHTRVSKTRLIDLQADALRALRLEAEARRVEAEASRYEALTRALRVGTMATSSGTVAEEELPLRADGSLHEEAYLAMVDARVWATRQSEFEQLVSKEN